MVKAITDHGGTAISVQGDVSKEAGIFRLFEETNNAFGTLDILDGSRERKYLFREVFTVFNL